VFITIRTDGINPAELKRAPTVGGCWSGFGLSSGLRFERILTRWFDVWFDNLEDEGEILIVSLRLNSVYFRGAQNRRCYPENTKNTTSKFPVK